MRTPLTVRQALQRRFAGFESGVALLMILAGAGICRAHGVETGYTYVTVAPERLEVTVAFNLSDLAAHRPLDRDQDQRLSPEELDAGGRDLSAYAAAQFTVTVDGHPAALQPQPSRLIQDAAGQEFLHVPFAAPLARPPREVAVSAGLGLFDAFGSAYTNLIVLTGSDGQVQQGMLSLQERTHTFALGGRVSPAGQARRWRWFLW